MKTKLLSLLAIVLLSGCASTMVESGLNALTGKHIDVAFSVIGYPDSKQKFGNDTVYIWKTSSMSSYNSFQTSYHSGYVGDTPYSGTSSYSTPQTVHNHAELKIITNSKGIIKAWDFYGNDTGLHRYAGRLNEYAKNMEALNDYERTESEKNYNKQNKRQINSSTPEFLQNLDSKVPHNQNMKKASKGDAAAQFSIALQFAEMKTQVSKTLSYAWTLKAEVNGYDKNKCDELKRYLNLNEEQKRSAIAMLKNL